ncbi:MAG: DCC1-like thiol-disulfide oxidoreductase family protein [Saprospiraceae bacterium]|jgi:predicted DCC family thiol-disulfide oxidoreductase YuxK|nr:DCC1-like thiol-disulfide oxidoreductase family protein [Saprospiraceae bacterium]
MISTKGLNKLSEQNAIILYDGDCILCSRFVQWVIHHDKKDVVRFCCFQKIENDPFKMDDSYSTVVMISEGQYYTKSEVIFRIVEINGGFWSLFLPFKFVPLFIRNYIYDWIARNRYNWFGQKKNCLLMTSDIESKFVKQ